MCVSFIIARVSIFYAMCDADITILFSQLKLISLFTAVGREAIAIKLITFIAMFLLGSELGVVAAKIAIVLESEKVWRDYMLLIF